VFAWFGEVSLLQTKKINWTWAFLGYTGFAYGSHAAQFLFSLN
jgi:hypothetical protein